MAAITHWAVDVDGGQVAVVDVAGQVAFRVPSDGSNVYLGRDSFLRANGPTGEVVVVDAATGLPVEGSPMTLADCSTVTVSESEVPGVDTSVVIVRAPDGTEAFRRNGKGVIVETTRSLVATTASGQTAIVDSAGIQLASLPIEVDGMLDIGGFLLLFVQDGADYLLLEDFTLAPIADIDAYAAVGDYLISSSDDSVHIYDRDGHEVATPSGVYSAVSPLGALIADDAGNMALWAGPQPIWTVPHPGGTDSGGFPGVVASSEALVFRFAGGYVCIDAASGTQLWEYPENGNGFAQALGANFLLARLTNEEPQPSVIVDATGRVIATISETVSGAARVSNAGPVAVATVSSGTLTGYDGSGNQLWSLSL